MSQKVYIGMAGFGTVGQGVYRVLERNAEVICRRCVKSPEIKTIVCRHTDRARKLLPNSVFVSDDPIVIAKDPEISIAIEVMGGIEPARSFILEALKNGKDVVTANKALLATHGKEIFEAANSYGRSVFFEAAVAGGIPIIKALREGLAANQISKVQGLLNGTCNYILSSMHESVVSFEKALTTAQKLGFAEADPTFDIEGLDTAHKLTILTSLAFGGALTLEPKYVTGITSVTATDIAIVKKLGFAIKLLAQTELKDNSIDYRVAPTLLEKSSLLAQVSGAMNAVEVESDAVGKTFYYGAGAGGDATASAVLADVIDCLRGHQSQFVSNPSKEALSFTPLSEQTSRFYVRVQSTVIEQYLKEIESVFKHNGITTDEVYTDEQTAVFFTHPCKKGELDQALEQISQLNSTEITIRTFFIAD